MFPRKPRFKRVKEIPLIQLTPRDVQILWHVSKHRFLTSRQIFSLVGGSPQQLLRRLQLLFHHGYLDRPRGQINICDYQRGGSQHLIYGLGNHGAEILEERLSIPRRKVDWTTKNREATWLFLQHTLFVADVVIAVELGCRANGKVRMIHQEEILSQIPETARKQDEPFRWKINLSKNGKPIQLGVVPDKIFALQSVDQPENTAYFFLEADRATMPVSRNNLGQTSFYRKLLAYSETWQQKIHTSRFGFNRFRVLTVTTSPKRVQNLTNACRDLPRGHGLFLFTDRELFKACRDPFVLEWQTGKPGQFERLFN